MHYDMKMTSRKASDEEARRVLEQGEFCVVATCDADGAPYGVPLSYVMKDGVLYVHSTNAGGHKADDFERDGRVCATVVQGVAPCYENGFFSTRYESAMVFGTIRRVQDEGERRMALAALCMKYVPSAKGEIAGAIERGVAGVDIWRIDPEEVSGKIADTVG